MKGMIYMSEKYMYKTRSYKTITGKRVSIVEKIDLNAIEEKEKKAKEEKARQKELKKIKEKESKLKKIRKRQEVARKRKMEVEELKRKRRAIKEQKKIKTQKTQSNKKTVCDYNFFKRKVTARKYTNEEKMDLIILIGQSGLAVDQRKELISLIETK